VADDTPTAPEAAKPAGPKSAILPEPPLPGEGTPEGDALRRARALFHLGDYAEMRALLTPLLQSKNAPVADAAAELLRRIAVDPVQIAFLVGCLVAILTIAFVYLR
jgi:plasmid stability protein